MRAWNEGESGRAPGLAGTVMRPAAGGSRPQPGVDELTDRELDVLREAARGLTNKAIGVKLNISDRTVQGHLANVFAKLHVTTRTEAVMRAVNLGWIPPVLDNLDEAK